MKLFILNIILIFLFCLTVSAQTNQNSCPEIKFDLPNGIPVPEKTTIFEVKVGENAEKLNLSYEWTFSKGQIIRGQGTSRVEFIVMKEDEGSSFEVSVKIVGLPRNCSNTYSDVIPVASPLIGDPFDAFGKLNTLDEYKAIMDNFMLGINDNPLSEGLISTVLNKNAPENYKIASLKQMYKSLIFRKYDLTRITFAISEGDYEEQTSLWIVPPGAQYPTNAPELEETLIKAEEFSEKINKLFPKK
ncbi:MAG TPA: hypothetical protein PKE69_01790 [Pyrinomonadaceae bacterium]|nr:hypothetical protein [Pyrinomonadaceae bacterium]